MKKIFALLSCVFLLAACGGGGGSSGSVESSSVSSSNGSSSTTTSNGKVQGVVIDTVTGKPIVGVTVRTGWASAITDKSGAYDLGTTPVLVFAGNVAMPDGSITIAIDTTSVSSPNGYGSTYSRRVNTSQASDTNILRIGKLNSTLKGIVGIPAHADRDSGVMPTIVPI